MNLSSQVPSSPGSPRQPVSPLYPICPGLPIKPTPPGSPGGPESPNVISKKYILKFLSCSNPNDHSQQAKVISV